MSNSSNKFQQSVTRYGVFLKKINWIIATWIPTPGADAAASATVAIAYVFESFCTTVRYEIGTETILSFLNHFMGTYDMFLIDLGLSTDYKSVALPIELWGRKKFFSWKHQIKQA
jgi:hypothetical protein